MAPSEGDETPSEGMSKPMVWRDCFMVGVVDVSLMIDCSIEAVSGRPSKLEGDSV